MNISAALTAIHDDLTFSKRSVYMWVKLPETHYEFRSDNEREGYVHDLSVALQAILYSEEHALDAHLYVTSEVFDAELWKRKYKRDIEYGNPPEHYNYHVEKATEHIESMEFRDKNAYLGINLGSRDQYSPTKHMFSGLSVLDPIVSLFTGERDEYVTDDELAFWREKGRLARFSLTQTLTGGLPVEANELAYIFRKNFFPGMPSPTVEELSIAGNKQWGAGEIVTLTDGDFINTPKWVQVNQLINGEVRTGYRATLVLAKFPDELQFPAQEPWIHILSQLPFPVDVSTRFSIVPPAKVKKQVGSRIKEVIDQYQNMTANGGQASIEVEESYELGQQLDYLLTNSDIPWMYARHRIHVEADNPELLAERCQSIIDLYKGKLKIIVVWPTGDQLDLLLEGLPNDKVRLKSYHQRHELNVLGAGIPAGSGGVGDLVEIINGKRRGHIGGYLGYTDSRIIEPVFLSVHSSISRNHPSGLVIIGESGSGKSFCGFSLTYEMALTGVKTIMIDPKGESLGLKTLPGLQDAQIIDIEEGDDGLIDPFQIMDTTGERLDLAKDTIEALVGAESIGPEEETAIARTLKIVLKDRYPTMNKVTEILMQSDTAAGQALGEKLSIIRQLPYARLCFSTASKSNPIKPISLDSRLTIITLLGLDLPNTNQKHLTGRNRLAVAILFLLTSFARKLLIGNPDEKEHPKALVVDEAWALTSTTLGGKIINEFARLGRAWNLGLILISQSASDFLDEGIINNIGTRIAFRNQNMEANGIPAVLKFLDLPDTPVYQEIVRDLKNGQCIMRDSVQRKARMQVDMWNEEVETAMQTNPLARRKKLEEEEAMHAT